MASILRGVWGGVRGLGTLFFSGLWKWLGLTLYIFYDNRAAFGEFFSSGNPLPVLVSFGEKLGHADRVILENTQSILSLQAQSSVFQLHLFGFQWFSLDLTLITYLSLLWGVVSALLYILWYFKLVDQVFKLIFGPGDSHLFATLVFAPLVYALIILNVRDVNPFTGVVTFFQNLGEVFKFELLSNQTVNESMNLSEKAANRSFT